jgi:hypothetical protein
MMRRPLASLALLAICGSLTLAASAAGAARTSPVTRSGPDPLATAPTSHIWPFTLSPAPEDLSLAVILFPHAAHGKHISGATLQLAAWGAFGDDYLVLAAPRVGAGRALSALVLLVNRPSPLLDPVTVHLRLRARAQFGRPVVRRLADPFARAASASRPAVCDLALHGAALNAAEVRPLSSRGAALSGFDAPAAVAQAYDVVCALPYESAFAQAVGQPAAESPSPSPSPTPSPTPPAPGPPVCAPCDPAPGFACPLSIGPDICAADLAPGGHGPRLVAIRV